MSITRLITLAINLGACTQNSGNKCRYILNGFAARLGQFMTVPLPNVIDSKPATEAEMLTYTQIDFSAWQGQIAALVHRNVTEAQLS